MLDRLISGAGAVTDAADRSVRSMERGSGSGLASTRPGSVAVAAILLILAAILVMAGLEATDDPRPASLAPADVATAADLGNRTYASMHGSVYAGYVETYYDDNANSTQDPGENGINWYYWLVDPTARSGVTVRSARPPSEVFSYRASGVVVEDAAYVTEILADVGDEAESLDLEIDRTHYIDTTGDAVGAAAPFDLATTLPADGTTVEVSGPRLGTFLSVCDTDSDLDGTCGDDEAVAYDLVVFDPVSKHGLSIRVAELPEFTDATITGLLRRDERAVDDARTTDGLRFDELDLTVSSRYVLDDEAAPASAPLAFGLAGVLALVAGTILIGLAGGYLIYRRAGRLPGPSTTLGPGERIPVRITGLVNTPSGRLHVREVPGALVRFVLRPATPATPPAEPATSDDAPVATPATTTLLVEREGRPQGVALGPGETIRLSSGSALAFRGPRPALRVVAGTGPLLLSFDSEAERDRAAAELLDDTGLGPDGTHLRTS
jgi:hypothetical protein